MADKDKLGPPAMPNTTWTVYNGSLYMNANIPINDKWHREGLDKDIAITDAKWISWYGKLQAGPFNTDCLTWDFPKVNCDVNPQPMPPKVPSLPTDYMY